MEEEALITVEGVSKKFCRSLKKSLLYGIGDIMRDMNPFAGRHPEVTDLRSEEFWAVKDVSFELKRGECLGLIGRNGAGKTTLLKMLNGLIKPDAGCIRMHGRVGALIALGAGFNPILTGRENVFVNGAVLGLTRSEIEARMDEIIDFAEMREFIDAPVQGYSSGMQVRLGFAVATALDPDILLLDEVLAVGDAAFRNKCYRRVAALRKKAAMIFVSHSMEQVSRICDRTVVMARGKAVQIGDPASGVLAYEHLNESTRDNADSFLSLHPPITAFAAELKTPSVSTGQSIGLGFDVQASAPLKDFQLRIYFYSRAGHLAAECGMRSGQAGVRLREGAQRWDFELDSATLKNGSYRLSINVIDEKGELLVWCYKNHEVTVTDAFSGALADCCLKVGTWRAVT